MSPRPTVARLLAAETELARRRRRQLSDDRCDVVIVWCVVALVLGNLCWLYWL